MILSSTILQKVYNFQFFLRNLNLLHAYNFFITSIISSFSCRIQSIMTMMNVPEVDEQLSLYSLLQKRKVWCDICMFECPGLIVYTCTNGMTLNELRISVIRLLCVHHLQEISIPAVTIILDKCVYGGRAVITQVLESDKLGCYPPQNHNEHSIVLRQMVKSLYSVSCTYLTPFCPITGP